MSQLPLTKISMSRLRYIMKGRLDKAIQRDRSSERYVYAASRFLWPWREYWLIILVGFVAVCDYTSTYIVLELSGRTNVHEVGWIASRVLQSGGFPMLLLVDVAAVAGLSLTALFIRSFCVKFGFEGFGRAIFIILLIPYAVVALIASVNNLLLTFI